MGKKLKQTEKRIPNSKAFLVRILEEDSGRVFEGIKPEGNSRIYEQHVSSDSRNILSQADKYFKKLMA